MAHQKHSQGARVCLCADDFGMDEGVNTAVLRLIEMERVHATSCMVGAPAWRSGASALRQLDAAGVDVGLHLDMTEFPLLPGSRRSLRGLMVTSLLGWLDHAKMMAEIRAQFDAFEDALGRAPAFVDGHQHVHQLPGIRGALLKEMGVRYATVLPWVRSSAGPGAQEAPAVDLRTTLKAVIITALGSRGLRTEAVKGGVAQNAALLGVYDFQGGPDRYRALLAAWLKAAGDADLLMCHPSAANSASDPIASARHAEYEVLLADNVPAMLRSCGVALMPMSRILHTANASRDDAEP